MNRGVLWVCAAATLWGTLGIAAKIGFCHGFTPIEAAICRSLSAALLFSIESFARGWGPRWVRRDLVQVLLFGIVGVAGLEASNLLAVEAGGAGFASILLYTAPAWVALHARFARGEHLGVRKTIALACAILGVAGVSAFGSGTGSVSAQALGYGLVSGFSYALFYIFGKPIFERLTIASVYAVSFAVAALVLAPAWRWDVSRDAIGWASMAYAGLFATYGAYFCYGRGLKLLDPTRASILATLEPVVSAVAATVILHERLAPLAWLSGGVVLIGVLLMSGKSRERATLTVEAKPRAQDARAT